RIRFAADPQESSSFSLAPAHRISVFLDASPFNIKSASGTLYWESDSPISVAALQTFRDASHPFLMTNFPVVDKDSLLSGPLLVPVLPAAEQAELSLVNPTDTVLRGRVTWFSAEKPKDAPYTVNARSALRISPDIGAQWIQITPETNHVAPETVLTSIIR